MKSHARSICIAAALGCANASAQGAATRTRDEVLTQDEGLAQISDGLYARTSSASVSYVAVTPAGMNSLLQKLVELKAAGAKTGPEQSGSTSPSVIDQLIADLSQPQPKNHETEAGDCAGPGGTGLPQLYVNATSSLGISASAQAELTDDSNPATPTTNKTRAGVDNGAGLTLSTDSSTTIGTIPATASASSAAGCKAFASASVTCPGHTTPSIAAYASSQMPVDHVPCLPLVP